LEKSSSSPFFESEWSAGVLDSAGALPLASSASADIVLSPAGVSSDSPSIGCSSSVGLLCSSSWMVERKSSAAT